MGGFEPQNYQCDGWQGKVYKINGSEPGYPNLEASTGYPDDILGLGGVNCRHRMFPFWKGISTPNPIKYDEEENKRIYEARQHQRKLERDMRLLKKKKACADVIGDTETSDMLNIKIQAKSNELNNWCKANNLKRDYSRELVSEQIVKNNQKGFTNISKNNIIVNEQRYTEYIDKEIVDNSNEGIRKWYIGNVENIPNKLNYNLPLEELAKQAFNMRNEIRHTARENMGDVDTREMLDINYPDVSFEWLLTKKQLNKKLSKYEAMIDIIKTASKTNARVNKNLNV